MEPHASSASPMEPIAIVGMAARFPMAQDLQQFWDNIVYGHDCITDVHVRCGKCIRSIGELRSGPVIIVPYATQDVSPLDRPGPRRRSSPDRTLLIDALMGSGGVVIAVLLRLCGQMKG